MQHTIVSVAEFHAAFNHPISETVTTGDEKLRILRVRLIAEELGELCEALGLKLNLNVNAGISISVEPDEHSKGVDLVEVADALGDLDYVVQGTNLVFGIPAQLVTQEIHRANMSKLGADGMPIYDEFGKVMKGPDYKAPDVKKVIDRTLAATTELETLKALGVVSEIGVADSEDGSIYILISHVENWGQVQQVVEHSAHQVCMTTIEHMNSKKLFPDTMPEDIQYQVVGDKIFMARDVEKINELVGKVSSHGHNMLAELEDMLGLEDITAGEDEATPPCNELSN